MNMLIGERLRSLREGKELSQGDIERRTGLLRCYISRVEHGHTVPSIETLEKFARALETPLYQIVYDGAQPPAAPPDIPKSKRDGWGNSRKEVQILNEFRRLLSQTTARDRTLLLAVAQTMARKRKATA
jgi:transcriptional regulator with XRE-family HTH domain